MKAILTYWIIGCGLIGMLLGPISDRCPNDRIEALEIVSSVAIWPALIVGVVTSSSKAKATCKVLP